MTNRALIIGSGSIATKHQEVIKELGLEVALVTKRAGEGKRYSDISTGLTSFEPTYVVIASPTAQHAADLAAVSASGFNGTVLIEKPVFSQPRSAVSTGSLGVIGVGYQLRFHPALQALKVRLAEHRVLSCHAYCGQYLPSWRPGRDYRAVYSSIKAAGGGVLRDLSHELDYLSWLFGPVTVAKALIRKSSSLEIDSEDTAGVLLTLERCPVATLQLNYTDRLTKRELVVVTDTETFVCDLIKHTLTSKDGGVETFSVTGLGMLKGLHAEMLQKDGGQCCTFAEAVAVIELIEALEKDNCAK